MTTLNQDLALIGSAIGAEPGQLEAFAAEDAIGGYHPDPAQSKFPAGSLWGVEGQVLYAVCRFLKPKHVVEIGTFRGASATHILSALKANDPDVDSPVRRGLLTTIDIHAGSGEMIPPHLRGWCRQVVGRGQDMIPDLPPAQVIFEDASHVTSDVEEILRAALGLRPKIIISHDARHFREGPRVRAGWERVFGSDFSTILTDPSDCGLAYKIF